MGRGYDRVAIEAADVVLMSGSLQGSRMRSHYRNGLPARLGVFQTPAGKAISHLSWVERRRMYELWIDANVVGTPLRERVFALAASLPPSVPACPNERPPKPMRIGADGFPVHEPMPLTLTQAEMDAMFDQSKRPCK